VAILGWFVWPRGQLELGFLLCLCLLESRLLVCGLGRGLCRAICDLLDSSARLSRGHGGPRCRNGALKGN
jgi:hypothetical protein